MKKMFITPRLFLIGILTFAFTTQGKTYYLDSESGNDGADGLSPATAWKTLGAMDKAAPGAGDRLLFRRGGLWRGSFHAKSGEKGNPLFYGAYGKGAKPIIENSVARDSETDWAEVKPGIWATRPSEVIIGRQLRDLKKSFWYSSFQNDARGSLRQMTGTDADKEVSFTRVTCVKSGKQSNYIQLWGPQVKDLPASFVLRVRMRSSIPFSLQHNVCVMKNSAPWTTFAGGLPVRAREREIGKEWKNVDILLHSEKNAGEGGFLHFNLGGNLPDGAVFDFETIGLWNASFDRFSYLPYDVGIFILNHGEAWGVKKWRLDDLKKPLDYWYEKETQRVYVRCDGNPAKQYKSVELAFTKHIIDQGGCHDVVYDGLAVRYGGAHGFGGGNTKRIVIRNCDIYWIGGGLQYWKGDRPVRFGNAIEFWGAAEGHLVENNRIWQVYDAALTNQTAGSPERETDIIWRNNVIWQSEYSFEYWNHDPKGFTGNILFENNTCVDAGFGYAHAQRPDKNGAHLMFYSNVAPTTNFVIRNNIFCGTSDRSTRMWNDWRKGLTLQNNLYFLAQDKVVLEFIERKKRYRPAEFTAYQSELEMDKGSVFAEPQFVDAAKHDYRLKPGTIGTSLATDGGAVGAR